MKAVIPFHINGFVKFKDKQDLKIQELGDEARWKKTGLKKTSTLFDDEDKLVQDTHLDVCILERVLPSAAINRHVALKKAEMYAKYGETPKKADIATWKEMFVLEHLPTAPVRETVIRVAVVDNTLFVGTSNVKLAEDIVSWLNRESVIEYSDVPKAGIKAISPQNNAATWLELVYNGDVVTIGNETIELGNSLKLLNLDDGARKISIRNNIECGYDLITASTVVSELGIYIPDNAGFVLSDKGIFKSIKLAITPERDVELAEASRDKVIYEKTQWVMMQQCLRTFVKIIAELEKETEL